MVRPERFELPTLWFEAKCSIQLSYGRAKKHNAKTLNAKSQLRRSNRLGLWRYHKHRHLLNNVQPRAPQKLMDHWLRQPACIILHPHGLLGFIYHQAPNPINLAHLRHRQRGRLARRNTITVKNIKLCHISDDTSANPKRYAAYSRAR